MSPKPRRPENRGLPKRWEFYHGAYYYRVPPGQEAAWGGKKRFRLGTNLADAYRVYAERVEAPERVRTVGDLLDRYALEVVPAKAAKTAHDNRLQLKHLHERFHDIPLASFKPQWVYAYVEARSAKVSARREIALLSHAFTKAVEWGLVAAHPFKGQIRLPGEKPRTRYVEDWEVVDALALRSRRRRGSVATIQAYVRLKLLTGLRQGDLLRLRTADLHDDGIHVTTHKTQRAVVYPWTDELRYAVDAALAARAVDISPFLFCTRKGAGYVDEAKGTASGWASMWQRFMTRVLAETRVGERFTEHDLRAKTGSDAESLERARQLLAHADARTTQRIYRRKAEIVKPLK